MQRKLQVSILFLTNPDKYLYLTSSKPIVSPPVSHSEFYPLVFLPIDYSRAHVPRTLVGNTDSIVMPYFNQQPAAEEFERFRNNLRIRMPRNSSSSVSSDSQFPFDHPCLLYRILCEGTRPMCIVSTAYWRGIGNVGSRYHVPPIEPKVEIFKGWE